MRGYTCKGEPNHTNCYTFPYQNVKLSIYGLFTVAEKEEDRKVRSIPPSPLFTKQNVSFAN